MQLVPAFDQNVLVSTALVARLASNFQGSIAEDAAPASDFHSLAGLQAAGSQSPDNAAGSVDVPAQVVSEHGTHSDTPQGKGLIKPWLDDKGKLNQPFWSALTQRVVSVVMRNPGKLLVGSISQSVRKSVIPASMHLRIQSQSACVALT